MIEERELLSLVEGLTVEEIELSVAQGWVAPARRESARLYVEVDVARLRLIHELRADLAIGDEAVPVLLSLLDQVHGLRTQLRDVLGGIARQPEDVRARIAEAIAEARQPENGRRE